MQCCFSSKWISKYLTQRWQKKHFLLLCAKVWCIVWLFEPARRAPEHTEKGESRKRRKAWTHPETELAEIAVLDDGNYNSTAGEHGELGKRMTWIKRALACRRVRAGLQFTEICSSMTLSSIKLLQLLHRSCLEVTRHVHKMLYNRYVLYHTSATLLQHIQ